MSESDAESLEKITLEIQNDYRVYRPDALGAELPSSNHVLRALIRYASAEIATKSPVGVALTGFCSGRGQLWGD